MTDATTTGTGGIGFTGALALLFIGLKLGHVIDWPWIWVLSPLWIGVAFAAVVFATLFIALGVTTFCESRRQR